MKHIITFTGTPQENAEDQMTLSQALAIAVGTLENVESSFVDGLTFTLFWEGGFIGFEVGDTTCQLTQPEALHHAAILRQAALSAGATVM
ncbi:MAG: hypothetical protein JXR80_03975 [Deltaproteobacteria bacterium]|nr:hypothetical protein [Deltaproteobacteria bacterium]